MSILYYLSSLKLALVLLVDRMLTQTVENSINTQNYWGFDSF